MTMNRQNKSTGGSPINIFTLISCLILVPHVLLTNDDDLPDSSRMELDLNYIFIDSFCQKHIESDKDGCIRESLSNWNSVADRQRAGCCISWDINDCLLNAIYDKCDRVTYKRVKKIIDEHNDAHSGALCQDYPHGSYKCHFPVWATIVIVLFAVVLIIILSYGFCMWWSHRQASRFDFY